MKIIKVQEGKQTGFRGAINTNGATFSLPVLSINPVSIITALGVIKGVIDIITTTHPISFWEWLATAAAALAFAISVYQKVVAPSYIVE